MDINVVFDSEWRFFLQGQAQFRRTEELYSPWPPVRARAMDGPLVLIKNLCGGVIDVRRRRKFED